MVNSVARAVCHIGSTTWGHLLSGQHIPFHCDNLPILQAWANQSSKHLGIMELLEDTLFHRRTAQLHCVPCAPPGSAELHRGCPVTEPHVTLLFSGPTGTSVTPPTASRTLEDHLQFLLTKAVAPSTSSTYKAGIQRYLSFCKAFGLVPLPGSKHSVTLSRYLPQQDTPGQHYSGAYGSSVPSPP